MFTEFLDELRWHWMIEAKYIFYDFIFLSTNWNFFSKVSKGRYFSNNWFFPPPQIFYWYIIRSKNCWISKNVYSQNKRNFQLSEIFPWKTWFYVFLRQLKFCGYKDCTLLVMSLVLQLCIQYVMKMFSPLSAKSQQQFFLYPIFYS